MQEGRGSPHGGVFLDIAWIKKRMQNSEEHIKRKLPSMYHQFKQLADIDITKEPMEVGPTTHYVMGGVRVDADTQMSSVPGLFAAGECAAGHQRREPARRQFAVGSAGLRQARRRVRGEVRARTSATGVRSGQADEAAHLAVQPFEPGRAENPYTIQHELQDAMQRLVGIVRQENEMVSALDVIDKLARAGRHRRRPWAP